MEAATVETGSLRWRSKAGDRGTRSEGVRHERKQMSRIQIQKGLPAVQKSPDIFWAQQGRREWSGLFSVVQKSLQLRMGQAAGEGGVGGKRKAVVSHSPTSQTCILCSWGTVRKPRQSLAAPAFGTYKRSHRDSRWGQRGRCPVTSRSKITN